MNDDSALIATLVLLVIVCLGLVFLSAVAEGSW